MKTELRIVARSHHCQILSLMKTELRTVARSHHCQILSLMKTELRTVARSHHCQSSNPMKTEPWWSDLFLRSDTENRRTTAPAIRLVMKCSPGPQSDTKPQHVRIHKLKPKPRPRPKVSLLIVHPIKTHTSLLSVVFHKCSYYCTM
jgi:hypothetical protein